MKVQEKNDELLTESPREQQTTSTMGAHSDDAQSDVNDWIARRAYELWEERGGGDGEALNDWLRAESEVQGSISEPADESTPRPAASGAGAS